MSEVTPPTVESLVEQFFASAGGLGYSLDYPIQISPSIVDERTRLFGSNVYKEMLFDDDVAPHFETRQLAAASEFVTVVPADGANPEDPDDIKNIYAAFVKRALSFSGKSLKLINAQLAKGLAFGNKACEVVYTFGVGEDAGRIVVSSITPIDEDLFYYVVGPKGNLLGAAPRRLLKPGEKELLSQVVEYQFLIGTEGVVPKEKLLIFTNNPENGYLIGTSVLSAAYTPWYMKTRVIPEFYAFMKRFSQPSIVGKTPLPKDNLGGVSPIGEPVQLPDGQSVNKKATEVLREELLKFLNGSVIAVKGGTEIDLIHPNQGASTSFEYALSHFGKQIALAILGTSQMSTEAKHESKSSKGVSQDVVGLRVAIDREGLSEAWTTLAWNLIRVNFGEAALIHAPTISVSEIEQQDKYEALKAYSHAYEAGFILLPQLEALHRSLGLPPLPEGYIAWLMEQDRQRSIDNSRLFNPDAQA
jgi:hypothetical protein